MNDEQTPGRVFSPPTEQEVDAWRAALEQAACGGVEQVWPRLSVVIAEMRRSLGYDGRTTPASTPS